MAAAAGPLDATQGVPLGGGDGEIARTFDELGLTPGILEGAADLYAFVAETQLARESPESRDRTRDLDAVVAVLARNAAQRASATLAPTRGDVIRQTFGQGALSRLSFPLTSRACRGA